MPPKQLLHLVFGGELTSPRSTTFKDVARLHVVGVFPNYAAAHEAWQAAARATIDNALMRYFIVHIHRLLDPSSAPDEEDVAPRRRAAQKTAARTTPAGRAKAARPKR